jgi:hypothetical protein
MILACYKLLLEGMPEKDILKTGYSKDTWQKCKTFHEAMEPKNHFDLLSMTQNYTKVAKQTGITIKLARNMKRMYTQRQMGEEITTHTIRYQYNKVPTIYNLMLSGVEEQELLRSGFSKTEIDKASQISDLIKADKLYSVLSKETNIPVNTLKKLKKTYYEHQESLMCPV